MVMQIITINGTKERIISLKNPPHGGFFYV
jgi:hypothetical protein